MITLAVLLLQTTAPVPPPAILGLGTLPRQALPDHGCAAYLWTVGDGRLVAMASADPARLRLAVDGGVPVDLPRVAQRGEGGLGLAGTTDYAGAGIAATLALAVATRADLRDGGTVPAATLTVARQGQDTLVVPLAGLVGCRG